MNGKIDKNGEEILNPSEEQKKDFENLECIGSVLIEVKITSENEESFRTSMNTEVKNVSTSQLVIIGNKIHKEIQKKVFKNDGGDPSIMGFLKYLKGEADEKTTDNNTVN
jgi:hypothetical protein